MPASKTIEIFKSKQEMEMKLPFFEDRIPAGFPSPALDFDYKAIDLNDHLVEHPDATFYGIVHGFSLKGLGIEDGDLLIIDRSLRPKDNAIAVCYLNGDFTAKRLKVTHGQVILQPENENYKPIVLQDGDELIIWGIIRHYVRTIKY